MKLFSFFAWYLAIGQKNILFDGGFAKPTRSLRMSAGSPQAAAPRISIDTWAVLAAAALILLTVFALLPRIPW